MLRKITREKQVNNAVKLELLLDKKKDIYQLAHEINWDWLMEHQEEFYCENNGRPSVSLRVMLGLHYIKSLELISDEDLVDKFCENPYWQYFCGYTVFQHQPPCNASSLSRWRKRLGEQAIERMIKETLSVAKKKGM